MQLLRNLPGTMLAAAAGLSLAIGLAPASWAKQKPSDEPPPPKAAPLSNVNAAPLQAQGGATIEGTPVVVDGSTLMIGDRTVRLYGIAAPAINANKGPDARLALDNLIGGQRVTCTEFDRTKDGGSVASCKIGADDVAEKMLQEGLAAVYRAGFNPTADERALASRYDAAEAEARQKEIGLWTKPAKAAPVQEIAKPDPKPLIDHRIIQNWIIALPILLIALFVVLVLAWRSNRQARQDRQQAQLNTTSLLAQILAEVLAIREAAAEQVVHTADLQPEQPVPASHLSALGLPPTLIYTANASQAHRLPRDIAVDLVQFQAAHAGIQQLLRQSGHLHSKAIRAALAKLIEAADLILERGQKAL